MSKTNRKQFDFIGKRFIFLGISGALILLGIVFNIIFGTQLDINFQGGTIFTYSYTGDINTDEVDALATQVLEREVEVSLSSDLSGGTQQLTISLPDKEAVSTELQSEMNDAMAEKFTDNNIEVLTTNSVKPSVGSGFFIKCLFAVVLGGILVTIYVGIRFRKIGGLSAGVFATLALLHDILIAYFVYVIFRIPLDDNFIAVELTLLGYSLNGTIVIFDRIRENRQLMDSKTPIDQLVNTSINQSLFRSFNTSLCTFAAIAIVAIMALATGMDAIISFAIPMMFGILSGFYTSTFLCCPLWVTWIQHKQKKALLAKEAAKAQPKKK